MTALAHSKRSIRYLPREAVANLGLSGLAMADAIENSLRAVTQGAVHNFPKTTKALPDGRLFQSIMAVGTSAPAPLMAATKVIGLSSQNGTLNLPHLGGVIVLNDGQTGLPMAIMDATWITEARTAAISLVAARRYARPHSKRIGFIASGAQAYAHLWVFKEFFPLEMVTAYSRGRASAEELANKARAMGLEARVTTDPHDAVSNQDIVVTSVPAAPELSPFLDATWLDAGSFATLVDLGRAWRPVGFDAVAHRIVDDRALAKASAAYRKLVPDGPYSAELADIATNPAIGRANDSEIAVFTFQGLALADLAVAALALQAAEDFGAGILLPA